MPMGAHGPPIPMLRVATRLLEAGGDQEVVRPLPAEVAAELDPGIRSVVRLLRHWGLPTSDSGDGKSKPADERALDHPHVMCCWPATDTAQATQLVHIAGFLHRGVLELGLEAHVELTFVPDGNIWVLMLGDLSDALLEARCTAEQLFGPGATW